MTPEYACSTTCRDRGRRRRDRTRRYANVAATRAPGPRSSFGRRAGSRRARSSCTQSLLSQAVRTFYSSHASTDYRPTLVLERSGIPSYAISFTTRESKLATVSIDNGRWQSKAYQAWTGVVPQGAAGDSNVGSSVTDPCGVTTCAVYSGQWQYRELVSNGVRLLSLSLAISLEHRLPADLL